MESSSQGSVNDLELNVMAAAEGKVGADPIPNIFSAYADNAYALDQLGQIVDLWDYFTEEEQAAYIPGYLSEGDFTGDGSIKILPTAKSTELLFLNETDWAPFAAATGADYSDLATREGLVAAAEAYYNWTDSLTPQPDDGQALFGWDSMSNYMLIGAKQLGCTIFEVEDGVMTLHFDKDVVRQLWDNYYVPFVKGYFSASSRFRSDDVKTGEILSYVGSSSSATYFPTQVITGDNEAHDIQRLVLPSPVFQNGEDCAVQQGAGMVVTKTSEEEVQASVTFLKWFTAPEHNIAFSVGSGYLPVTRAGSSIDAVRASGLTLSAPVEQLLDTALDTVNSSPLFTPKAFAGGTDARAVLDYAMSDRAISDRAVVEDRLAAGIPFEQAAAEFLTDDNFDAWYAETLAALEAFAG